MPKVSTPSTFPPPGNFQVSIGVTLLCNTPGASLFYTTDGSLPTRSSRAYDPYRQVWLEAPSDEGRGLTSRVTLRALAVKDGLQDADPAEFVFTLARRDQDSYLSTQIRPNVWMIRDYDDDKMFLLKGERRALLIDTGMAKGDLRAHVEKLTGGLPLEVVITHAHPDHIARVEQFQADCPVYMHPADQPMLHRFIGQMGFKIDPERIQPLADGSVFDPGGARLRAYAVPGHTPGSIALLDEQNGVLYAGDAVGSNRAVNADSLWMQFEGQAPIDIYLSTLKVFRSRVRGKLKEIYTGHNDVPVGEAYLDNLQMAAQNLVDGGPDVLVPSPRPLDAWQTIAGERVSSPDWAGINVSKERCLSAHRDKIATLGNLELSGAELNEPFLPSRNRYSASLKGRDSQLLVCATATSGRARGLRLNGREMVSGSFCPLEMEVGENRFEIECTSPDGSVRSTYHLVISVE